MYIERAPSLNSRGAFSDANRLAGIMRFLPLRQAFGEFCRKSLCGEVTTTACCSKDEEIDSFFSGQSGHTYPWAPRFQGAPLSSSAPITHTRAEQSASPAVHVCGTRSISATSKHRLLRSPKTEV